MPGPADHLIIRIERRFCTPREAAIVLGVSRSKIYEMMSNGELPFEEFAGARRIALVYLGMIVANAEQAATEAAERRHAS